MNIEDNDNKMRKKNEGESLENKIKRLIDDKKDENCI
jgi:hypothetical protein